MPKKLEHNVISTDDFKEGMRRLAASVNVITVKHNGIRDGLTATAACSVSISPPQLLICVNKNAGAHDLIQSEGAFGLNILARHHEDIAKRFAGIDGTDRKKRYDVGSWATLKTGAPILKDALASFDCQVVNNMSANTHSIIVGHIVAISYGDGAPLVYGDGQFTGLENWD